MRHVRECIVLRPEAPIELFLLAIACPLEFPDPLGERVDARRMGPERLEAVRHPVERFVRLSQPAIDLRLVGGTPAVELIEHPGERIEALRLRCEGVAGRSETLLELLLVVDLASVRPSTWSRSVVSIATRSSGARSSAVLTAASSAASTSSRAVVAGSVVGTGGAAAAWRGLRLARRVLSSP